MPTHRPVPKVVWFILAACCSLLGAWASNVNSVNQRQDVTIQELRVTLAEMNAKLDLLLDSHNLKYEGHK